MDLQKERLVKRIRDARALRDVSPEASILTMAGLPLAIRRVAEAADRACF